MKGKKLALAIVLAAGCISSAAWAEGTLTDGTYEGTGTGMGGELKVSVTVEEGAIADVTITQQAETYGVGTGMPTSPVETLPALIVENQTVEVDSVTGATISSRAIKTAVEDALTQAGAGEEQFHTPAAAAEYEETYEADVVVAGGGLAGLSAALSAAQNGASVVLLEKAGITGGSTTVSGGKLLGAGTAYQEAQGIEDSAEDLAAYMLSLGNTGDEETVRLFSEKTAGAIDWLHENGVEFTDVERIHSSIPTWRVHNVKDGGWMIQGKGGSITVPMTQAVLDAGVTVLTDTAATQIIMEDGKAAGLKAVHKEQEITVNAGSVILCTGGFANNQEMTASVMQSFAYMDEGYMISSAAVGDTGDGITMAAEAGAWTDITPGGSVTYLDFTTGIGVGEEAGLIVDPAGERVCNEFTYQYVLSAELAKRGYNKAFYITDADDPNPSAQYGMTLENTIQAESAQELAQLLGMDEQALEQTITTYNEACAAGEDAAYGKNAEYLNELTGTLYAFPMSPTVSFTFGGIMTDDDSHVLTEEGTVIEGLYAAGETAFARLLGTEVGVNYPSCGTSLSNDTIFGQIAGANAAAGK